MDAEIYSKQFYQSLGEISKSYKLKYSKTAFCVYKNLGDVFWSASFLCPSFLRDGQLEINVTNCLKPCAFDVVQFAIIDPEKKHRITDSLRVNASFKAGALQIEAKTYRLTCGDPDCFSLTVDAMVRTILEELIEKRTAFLSAVEKDGGLIQYLAHHWEEKPLEGGMAYLCKHDYIAAKRCFELAEEAHNIWLKSIGAAGRYLHLIFIDYCKALQAGLEWTEALVENGLPGV